MNIYAQRQILILSFFFSVFSSFFSYNLFMLLDGFYLLTENIDSAMFQRHRFLLCVCVCARASTVTWRDRDTVLFALQRLSLIFLGLFWNSFQNGWWYYLSKASGKHLKKKSGRFFSSSRKIHWKRVVENLLKLCQLTIGSADIELQLWINCLLPTGPSRFSVNWINPSRNPENHQGNKLNHWHNYHR